VQQFRFTLAVAGAMDVFGDFNLHLSSSCI